MSNVIENIAKQVLAVADPVLKDIDTVHKGVYNPTLQYVKNNIVTYNGSSYMCSVPAKGIVPTDTGYWQLVGSKGDKGDKGDQGIQGISFESRGQYDSNAIYNTGDVAIDAINQNLYASLIDNNQNNVVTDTTKWELLISVQSTVTSANNATTTAITAATNANTAATNVSNAESSRVTAEQARVTAEGTRSSTETTRGNNETSRQTEETNRASAESTRAGNETTRQTNETTRQTNESTRQSQETTRQTTISNLNHLGAWSSTTAYQSRNVVSLNGSSYMCIVPNTNQVPPNSTYWQVVGQKGADGTGSGSVTSVDSSNSDITVTSKTTTPTITLNSGTGANQIVKLDVDALVIADILKDGTTNKAYTAAEKTKLTGVSTGANKTESSATNGNIKLDGTEATVYTHPSTHPATMITEDTDHRWLTDAYIGTWNGKQNALGFTPVNKAGDTMLGPLTLSADPTASLHAASKQYVDSGRGISKLRNYMGVRF